MDNATTHMSEEFERLIEEAGAYLLYLSPYSTDLNPIDKMFSSYKMFLKRNSMYEKDEIILHLCALGCVTCDKAIGCYRSCGVPHTDDFFEFSRDVDNHSSFFNCSRCCYSDGFSLVTILYTYSILKTNSIDHRPVYPGQTKVCAC